MAQGRGASPGVLSAKSGGYGMGEEISCEGCGACCDRMLIEWSGQTLDLDWLKAHGGQIMGKYIVLPIKCEFYDEKTKKCKNYEKRPISCQKFKRGSVACIMCRHSKALKRLPE